MGEIRKDSFHKVKPLAPSFPVPTSRSQWLRAYPEWLLWELYIETSITTEFDQYLIIIYLLVSKF